MTPINSNVNVRINQTPTGGSIIGTFREKRSDYLRADVDALCFAARKISLVAATYTPLQVLPPNYDIEN